MVLKRLLVVGAIAGAAGCAAVSSPSAPSPQAGQPEPMMVPEVVPTAAENARYLLTFDSTWSAVSHPIDFPDSAHYSGLIGGTHAPAVSFWQEGSLATDGIRRMAERGSKSPLDDEVNRAIATGTAEFLISGPALGQSPGSVSLEFTVSQRFPLVTVVTMVAPSPDWFVGVSGLALFRNGQWLDELQTALRGFDAGTDRGRTYLSPDQVAVPPEPISLLTYPLTANGDALPLGSLTFRRLS